MLGRYLRWIIAGAAIAIPVLHSFILLTNGAGPAVAPRVEWHWPDRTLVVFTYVESIGSFVLIGSGIAILGRARWSIVAIRILIFVLLSAWVGSVTWVILRSWPVPMLAVPRYLCSRRNLCSRSFC